MKDRTEQTGQPASVLWPEASDAASGIRAHQGHAVVGGVGGVGVGVGSRANKPHAQLPVDPPQLDGAPYQLLAPLGVTAYGRAFRARHTEQGRELAVHFLQTEDDSEGTFASALPLAVAKCAQLSHPNVIAVEAHGRAADAGPYFLVTEPLEGVSLADYLDDLEVLPLARALGITLQIGRALRAAHKLGIVHGALSPANVRLVRSETGEVARVVGFASATFAPSTPDSHDVATFAYAAPECRLGEPPGPSADVFAIGALLWRMLTGQRPAVTDNDVDDASRSLSALCREPIPRALEELVTRCHARVPAERVPDVISVMRRLREIARGLHADDLSESAGFALRASSSTMPPAEAAATESDSGGSLFANEGGGWRSGVMWVAAGLLLALAAVWLLWDASARVHPDMPRRAAPTLPR